VKTPAPPGQRKLEDAIKANPAAGPAKLRTGIPGHPPMAEVDEAFFNQDRLAHHRRKMLKKTAAPKPQSVKNTPGALLQLIEDFPGAEGFLVNPESIFKKGQGVINMQSENMRAVLNECGSGLQSDTVEGVLHEPDFGGTVDLQITSMFDLTLKCWVPVLMSIIFGRTKKHFAAHWRALFQGFECENWTEFAALFPGVTLDWSDAEGESFLDELVEHSKGTIDHEEARTFVLKCSVHFKQSLTRIVKNMGVVGDQDGADQFRSLVSILMNGETTNNQFINTCKEIERRFPNAIAWLAWHLRPARAESFFPACQNHNLQESIRQQRLSKSTNAQENVGKQFQELFKTNHKMTVNEGVMNSWRFCSRFQADSAGEQAGLSSRYGVHPATPTKGEKRHKRTKNDGRAPDTAQTLRRQTQSWEEQRAMGRFVGPQWEFATETLKFKNTCPLDSMLMMLFVPQLCKAFVKPIPEISNPEGILTRSFRLMEAERHDEARLLWLEEVLEIDVLFPATHDIFGSTQRIVHHNPAFRPKNWAHPLKEFVELTVKERWVCNNPNCGASTVVSMDSNLADLGYSDVEVTENYKETTLSRLFLTFQGSMEQTIANLELREIHRCPRKGCKGPTTVTLQEVPHWPHSVLIDCQGHYLSNIPFEIPWRGKMLVLRSATVGNNTHFTAVLRTPTHFVSFDDIGFPKFAFHNLSDPTGACLGKRLDKALFEVIDLEGPRFGDPNHNWRSTLCHRGMSTNRQNTEPANKKAKTSG
jgi:hypothetical protein